MAEEVQQCNIVNNNCCNYICNEVNHICNSVCERCREGFRFPPAPNQDIEYIRSFPVGYRFKPSELELINQYLFKKLYHYELPPNKIIEENVYLFHPTELAEKYRVYGDVDKEWYFFTPRNRRYKNGDRPKRNVADHGFWKATGIDKKITDTSDPGELLVLGSKKTLVFYEGQQSKEKKKTNWIMHEYTVDVERPKDSERLDDWVLCKIYEKPEKKSLSRSSSSNDQNGVHTDNAEEDAEGELANGELALCDDLANYGEFANGELANGELKLFPDDDLNLLFEEDTSDWDLCTEYINSNNLGPDEHQLQQQHFMSCQELQINPDMHNMQEQQQLDDQRKQNIDGTQPDLTEDKKPNDLGRKKRERSPGELL